MFTFRERRATRVLSVVRGVTDDGGEQVAAGHRRADEPSPGRTRALLGLSVGIVLSVLAWLLLVRAAIDFGQAARDGRGALGWLLTVVAGAGAALCLMLGLVLVARLHALLRPSRPAPHPGSHRR